MDYQAIMFQTLQGAIYLLVTFILTLATRFLQKRLGREGMKKLFDELEAKKQIVQSVVLFVQQTYFALDGEVKYQIAVDRILAILYEKGLKITEAELQTLIEAAVKTFKLHFGKTWDELQ